jgi:hypothetical protein
MYGEHTYPTTMTCSECGEHITSMVDSEDVTRLREGMEGAQAFANRDGVPYLDRTQRELFISGICAKCWAKLLLAQQG